MASLLYIIGIIFGILLVGFLLTVSASTLVEQVNRIMNDYNYANRRTGNAEAGGELIRYSHWFSEDPKTTKLLQNLGRDLAERGFISNIDQIREEWRKNET